MARPRVFISSTFFDLRQVREDVSRFIKDLGYEAVLFEKGEVPYGSKNPLEQYCYKEIGLCDILISIVGGRYGSPSTNPPYSISQRELKHALQRGKQVYIFVEKGVHSEFQIYKANKDVKGLRYQFVDNPRVYEFLEEVWALPFNNPIFQFESSSDIIHVLRDQWAGLFQRLLQEESNRPQAEVLTDLKSTVATLQQAVALLNRNSVLEEVAVLEHPAFARVRSLLRLPYRVIFLNLREFERLVEAAGFKPVPADAWDEPTRKEWVRDTGLTSYELLMVCESVFEESGKLCSLILGEWDDDWILIEAREYGDAHDALEAQDSF